MKYTKNKVFFVFNHVFFLIWKKKYSRFGGSGGRGRVLTIGIDVEFNFLLHGID